MKKLKFIITVCLFGVTTLNNANAFLLEEQQLFTQKKGCFINYLTEKNTNGWYIETNREECGKDGYLSGYHTITVYNAFGKPIEHLKGHFSKGYWTGDTFLNNIEFQRSAEELGKQKAIFEISADSNTDVHYLGQMTTSKSTSGFYPPFKVCGPFRLMGVVKNIKKLDDPQYLQLIFTRAEKEIRRICPTDKKAMLFLSSKEKPTQQDIAMFVYMDLATRRHKIVRADELNAIPTPRQIKKEKGKTVSFVAGTIPLSQVVAQETKESANPPKPTDNYEPDIGGLNFESITAEDLPDDIDMVLSDVTDTEEPAVQAVNTPIKKAETQPNTPQKETKKTVTATQQSETPKKNNQILTGDSVSIEKEAAKQAASFFNSSGDDYPSFGQNDESHIASQRKSLLQPLKSRIDNDKIDEKVARAGVTDISDKIWPLSHILLTSQVLNAPVLAQTAIHIDQMAMDDTGIANQPILMDVQGSYVSNGWYIVKGYYIAYTNKKPNAPAGLVRTISTTKCNAPMCQEKK